MGSKRKKEEEGNLINRWPFWGLFVNTYFGGGFVEFSAFILQLYLNLIRRKELLCFYCRYEKTGFLGCREVSKGT